MVVDKQRYDDTIQGQSACELVEVWCWDADHARDISAHLVSIHLLPSLSPQN